MWLDWVYNHICDGSSKVEPESHTVYLETITLNLSHIFDSNWSYAYLVWLNQVNSSWIYMCCLTHWVTYKMTCHWFDDLFYILYMTCFSNHNFAEYFHAGCRLQLILHQAMLSIILFKLAVPMHINYHASKAQSIYTDRLIRLM